MTENEINHNLNEKLQTENLTYPLEIHLFNNSQLISRIFSEFSSIEIEITLSDLRLLIYELLIEILQRNERNNLENSLSINEEKNNFNLIIKKEELKSWKSLKKERNQRNESNENNESNESNENNQKNFFQIEISSYNCIEIYLSKIKSYDGLIFVIGDDIRDFSLYDNWIREDENLTLSELYSKLQNSQKLINNNNNNENNEIISPISLVLAYGYEMPAPNIRVILQQTRTATDMYGKNYTIYNMVVRQGKLEWMVEHRYSDFAKLHEALLSQSDSEMGYIPRNLLPHLTKKKIHSRTLLESTVDKRRIKLSRYINTLVSIEQAMSNHYVLSFLGTINTARFDSVDLTKGISRNTMHITKIRTEAKWGDIILFKCANTLSHLQRRVTRSEWDHVGIVVRSLQSNDQLGSLHLLEATGEGVTSYPLTGRLKAYHFNNFTKYMAIRQLKDFQRTPERMRLLDDFVSNVVGKPYGFTASQIFPSKNVQHTQNHNTLSFHTIWNKLTGSNTNTNRNSESKPSDIQDENRQSKEENGEEVSSTYFCSELVAAAIKQLGLLPNSLNPSYFWPGCFAKGDELDHLMIQSLGRYGDEFIIDCRVMEISRAIEKRPSALLSQSIIEASTPPSLPSHLQEKTENISAPKSTFVPTLF